jgi:predicted dehydrogenase
MSQLRWGFIGNGWIAKVLADDFKIAGLKIQAVGARTQAKADEFADTYGIPNRHDSYEKLVNDPEVDIVYVATPHPFHVRDAVLALNAGKHVLCEKPFAINGKEAELIAEAAKRNNVFIMEAMWTRFLPVQIAIQNVIKSGKIGDVKIVVADHTRYLVDIRRLWDPELGGGALLDLGIYPLNFIVRMLGLPSKIEANAKLSDEKVDEYLMCKMEFANGGMATFLTTNSVAGENRAVVYGDKGRIEIDGSAWEMTSFTVYNQAGEVIEKYNETHDGTGRQYQAIEVERCINAGLVESPTMPIGETVAIMKVMDQIRAQVGVKYPME